MMRSDMGNSPRHSAITYAALAVLLAACPTFAAQTNFDNSAGTGAWNNPTNWSTDALPTIDDQAVIHDGFTVSLTTPQVAGELVVSWPTGAGAPATPGTATLNIGLGADLMIGNPPAGTNTSGIRAGRTATAVGTSLAVINQTGGSVSIITGATACGCPRGTRGPPSPIPGTSSAAARYGAAPS
jgi:hypothetical protein